MCFWLCSGILPKTRRAIPGAHFINTRGPCASMSQEINMREQSSNQHQLPVLDEQTVSVLMRQILGRQDIELLKFQVHRASDWTGPATRGVYHLTGSGRDQEREVEWSLVLKVLSLTSEGSNPATSSETHVLYWKREALVYQSDLLDDLPGGVRGPRCYGIVEHADSSVWLWLEDVKEIYGPRWPLEQCARAAQSLGQMNGAYLAGRPLPSYPWLVRTGSPRGLLDHYGWMWKIVHDPSTWQHPRLCAAFPLPNREPPPATVGGPLCLARRARAAPANLLSPGCLA